METANPLRRFHLSDATLLTAATAIGFGLIRAEFPNIASNLSSGFQELQSFCQIGGWAYVGSREFAYDLASFLFGLGSLSLPIVLIWALAILPLQWMAARTSSQRIHLQPGFMASLAWLVAIGFVAIPLLILRLLVAIGSISSQFTPSVYWYDEELVMFGGVAIASAWMTMLFSRDWHPQRYWLDRLGRAIGGFWCAGCLLLWDSICESVSNDFSTGGFIRDFSLGGRRPYSSSSLAMVGDAIYLFVSYLTPLLALETLLLAVVGLILSRLQHKTLRQQPGVLCLLVSSVVILCLGLRLGLFLQSTRNDWKSLPYWIPMHGSVAFWLMRLVGLTVAVSWLTLFLGGHWKARPSWSDRIARVLGGLWIAVAFAATLSIILYKFGEVKLPLEEYSWF